MLKKRKKIVSSIIRVVGGRKGKDGLEERRKKHASMKKGIGPFVEQNISQNISFLG